MASMGQAAAAADHHLHQLPNHLNGISRLNCSPPPGALNSIPVSAFSNMAPNDYDHHHHHHNHRDKYMMEMHSGYHRDRFQRNVGSSPGYNTSNELPQQVWPLSGPNGDMHVHPPQENTILATGPSPIGMVGNERGCSEQQQITRGSPRVLSSSTPELYHGSGVVVSAGGDWDQFMDSNVRYNPGLLSSSQSLQLSQNSSHLGGNDGAMIRELIGRFEGTGNGVPSHVSSPQHSCSTTTAPPAGIDKALKLQGNAWNPSVDVTSHNMGLAVDPSKGGLALQGVGLSTSHCLPHFPSDPGFVERAARFSSFSNGNYSQPFPTSSSSDAAAAAATTGKTRSRQSSAQDNNHNHHHSNSSRQLQKTSSSISMNEIPNSRVKSSKEGPVSLDSDGAAHETGDGVADDMERDAREGEEAEAKAAAATLDNKKLCRTASSSLGGIDENHMQTGGIATPAAVREANEAADAELLLQQQNPAAPAEMSSVEDARGETCPSGVTHVSTAGGNKESPMKKRKGSLDDKSKDTTTSATVSSPANKTSDSDDVKAKRFKREDGSKVDKDADVKPKIERSSSETSGETSPRSAKEQSKPQEPPKQDYIHVRARRGQATDSHSLAERVRREKISERMKFLQDLVPGCSKVTGKAVMLDEIINYVQSLQRQVEHLSMKLAAVSPRLDFNIESLLAKEVSRSSQGMIMGPETSSYPQLQHPQQQHGAVAAPPCALQYPPVQSLGNNPAQLALRRTISAPIPALIPRGDDGFGNCLPQGIWDDGELQSIVQMGFGHLRSLSSQALLQGQLPPGHMKVEL